MQSNQDYVEIRLDRKTGDITVIDNGQELEESRAPMPLKDLGTVNTLDVALIYHASPGCLWYRGKLYCW